MPPGFPLGAPRYPFCTFPPFHHPLFITTPSPHPRICSYIVMIASLCTPPSCGHGIGTTAGAVRRCHFFFFYQTKAGADWKAAEAFWGSSRQCRSPPPPPPPPLCCVLLKTPRQLTRLRFIKDLLRRVFVMSLTFEDSRFGCLGREGARSWRTTSWLFFFCQWQRWQAVNRENAISFVVNYQPTQCDTRLRIRQDVLTSSPSCQRKTARRPAALLLPTCDSKAETIHAAQIPALTFRLLTSCSSVLLNSSRKHLQWVLKLGSLWIFSLGRKQQKKL